MLTERNLATRPASAATPSVSASAPSADLTKPRRKRLATSDARNVVLDAAEALLRTGGPQALRLGEIAARAGLSHSNVLYHFEGMPDLEAQLARRIVLRLANEVAEIYVQREAGEIPIELANQKLFDVMSSGDSGPLIWWMIQVSADVDLSDLNRKLEELCDLIASHPALAKVPSALLRPQVDRSVQLSVCTALGYGLLKSRYSRLFGTSADVAAIPDLLSDLQRGRMHAAVSLVDEALAVSKPAPQLRSAAKGPRKK